MAPTKTLNAPRGTIRGQSSQQVISFTIRARPLPSLILDFLLDNFTILKTLQRKKSLEQDHRLREEEQEFDKYGEVIRKPTTSPEQFWEAFGQKCKEVGNDWADIADRTWAIGPHKSGGCLLVDARKPSAYSSWVLPLSDVFLLQIHVYIRLRQRLNRDPTEKDGAEMEKVVRDIDNHIETGFELAVFQGPLCAEPVEGLAYLVEQVDVDKTALEREIGKTETVT